MKMIEVNHVYKTYDVYEHSSGFINSVKSFFNPTVKKVEAVNDLSFSIEKGELIGFIGENGAGKSTTIKMLSGILYPSSGEITVNGYVPYQNRKQNASNIGVIFGQRSRLMWDLPMIDSFELYKEIYKIDKQQYKRNVHDFIEMLDLNQYIKTPVRQLSLGQRMKVELALALLHSPKILFLDEPTIGLDVLAKRNIRNFILEQNDKYQTTTLLTSHDMKDLDVVCSRIIMISKGRLFFDGSTEQFKKQYADGSVVEIRLENQQIDLTVLEGLPVVVTQDKTSLTIRYHEEQMKLPIILEKLSEKNKLDSILTKETDIEDIVRNLYLDIKNKECDVQK